jgi:hypothetical protein
METSDGPDDQDAFELPAPAELHPDSLEAPSVPVEAADQERAVRRYYIAGKDLEKYGRSDGCAACDAAKANIPRGGIAQAVEGLRQRSKLILRGVQDTRRPKIRSRGISPRESRKVPLTMNETDQGGKANQGIRLRHRARIPGVQSTVPQRVPQQDVSLRDLHPRVPQQQVSLREVHPRETEKLGEVALETVDARTSQVLIRHLQR